jgi:hypothetical protein
VFFILSWFVYDGIDLFFNLIYAPATEAEPEVKPQPKAKKAQRTAYKTSDADKDIEKKDHTVAPDVKYINTQTIVFRESAFEKFLNKIFPKQLDYILTPYTFFLLLVLSVLPVIGILIYLIIYYFR